MAKKGSILICDDEEIMRDVLETLLSSAGYKVDLSRTGEEAIESYASRAYDLVLMDVSMPGMGGLTALEELVKLDPEAVVLMITAYATFDTAISAWEKGATGVIRKPFQNEQILSLVARGIKKRQKEEERQTLRQAMVRSVNRDGFIGRSEVMENVFRMVERVAPARSTVLITGESGTGKELVAKAIHEASPRANGERHGFRAFGVGAFSSRDCPRHHVRRAGDRRARDERADHLPAWPYRRQRNDSHRRPNRDQRSGRHCAGPVLR